MAKPSTSRLFLIIGVLGLALFAVQNVPRLFPGKLVYEDIPSLPGYRALASGEISQTADPFVGLDGGEAPLPENVRSWVAGNTCAALFSNPVNEARDDTVRIAYFTDIQCPYCRILSGTLSDLLRNGDPAIELSVREYPVFGAISETAAMASLAAGMQGAHWQFHKVMMAAPFRPNKAAIEKTASDLGLNIDQFRHDASSPEVLERSMRDLAIGDHFGVYGTPALVVGRTLVIGKIAPEDLERLIEIERRESEMDPCKGYRRN